MSHRGCLRGRVVDVRLAYGLTIDRGEADALEAVLSRCPAGDVREPFCPAARSVLRFVLPILMPTEAPAGTGLDRQP